MKTLIKGKRQLTQFNPATNGTDRNSTKTMRSRHPT